MGNLKVTLAEPLPFGSNNIGTVTLAPGTNDIGVYPAPTASSSFALIPGSSDEWENSHILKASAGNLYALDVITGAVAGFLMTFDSTTVPPDGAVTPVECVPVAANSFATIRSNGAPPDHYSNGIVAVFSITGPFTKTTTLVYGHRKYGSGRYALNAEPQAFFKWSVQ